MKFTIPCFVRVENPQERKELTEWMSVIGYRTQMIDDAESYIAAIPNHAIFATSPIRIKIGYHDCGTNIPLFKALAAMNEDGWREQWFISNVTMLFKQLKGMVETTKREKYLPAGSLFKLLTENPKFQFIGSANPLFRKATAEEIINYFKK